MTMRSRVFRYVERKYSSRPEYLWRRFPNYAIFRHEDNQKWFGLVMDVPKEKLGLPGSERVDILNVKLDDPLLVDFLAHQQGYFIGYHISNGNWISILLDGSVAYKDICGWIDASYMATASKQEKQKLRPPQDWIVPVNLKHCNLEQAFEGKEAIEWKQEAGIKAGDTVFLYGKAPVSAILYRCSVTETNLPVPGKANQGNMDFLMRIRLVKRYFQTAFPLERLRSEFGVQAVRGPRAVPCPLSAALRK